MNRKQKQPNKKRTIRMRVTNVQHDAEKRNQLYDEAESRSILGKYQLAAGTWQHPQTQLWQVWLSNYGSDINWISAHRDLDRAQQDVDAIHVAGQRGDFADEEKVVALFQRLTAAGDGEPANISAADIATITGSISGKVFETRYEGEGEGTEVEYRYTLPADDTEVIVSGASIAIIDSAKKPPLLDAHAIQERALWHCEMSQAHIREGELTNDYEGFKQLFIASYTTIYERDPQELTETVRGIITRHDMATVLIEIRKIIKALYFPDLADLERMAMAYKGVLIAPHRSLDGYYATFHWHQMIMRTPDLLTPVLALAQAQQMIDKLTEERKK